MNRRIFLAPGETVELLAQTGESLVKVQFLLGRHGNPQTFIWTQPSRSLHVDCPIEDIQQVLTNDPVPY